MDELTRRLSLAGRAVRTLDEVLKQPKTDVVRDAAIQRFEYSYETGWKAAQCFLLLGLAGDQDLDDPTGWKTAREFIGMWKDAPEGVPIARDHDKYLYGDE